MYVDDLTIFCRGHTIEEISLNLQTEIDRLESAARSNGFQFSSSKTSCIHFCRLRNEHPEPLLKLGESRINCRTHTKLLGLIFDRKLNWGEHINYITKRCSKSLNLMKCMANMNWGADREILLKLYTSLVRSRIDYADVIYTSARRSRLDQLDRIQNSALRIAIGAYRTTPIDSLNADTGIMPLVLRRHIHTLTYPIKCMTDTKHINYNLFLKENEFSSRPTVTRPTRVRFSELRNNYCIPDSVNLLRRSHGPPPWTYLLPTVNKSLSVWDKAEIPPNIIKNVFLAEVSLIQTDMVLYTDGSKTESGVGTAFLTESSSYAWSLDPRSSIYTAEIYAIWRALLFFMGSSHKRCLICTDSMSTVTALEDKFSTDIRIQILLDLIHHIKLDGKEVVFFWTPAHVGIPGNEQADRAAKEATLQPMDEGTPLVFSDIKREIKTVFSAWKERWRTYGGQLQEVKPTVDRWIYPKTLCRRQQVVLCRLRMGHTNLTHNYLLRGTNRPQCETCLCRLSIKHIILECPEYNVPRNFFEIQPTLSQCLENEQNVHQTLRFLKSINVFWKI
nr:unnamed protein product [Callosobruchus chinensis]